ncbi:hypothetical protein S7335_1199 [Synechococcus sp. PCC 7335]|uniref:hypothetical protein n=1 Tax=Synechococcus sp. (strain ATCC 29403 / PCC 7335) TaxID=91464 RepID=UPI00017EB935|nr:hypothetical protein [Synechococcus sp. PCC 7335]EDX82495.1 hypothetical protein S7335_1199 [Synechococcus sp. PCC 7335]
MSDEVVLWMVREGEGSDSTLLMDTIDSFKELAAVRQMDISQLPESTLEMLARGLLALDSEHLSLSKAELSNGMTAALFAATRHSRAHLQVVQIMQEKLRRLSSVRKTLEL